MITHLAFLLFASRVLAAAATAASDITLYIGNRNIVSCFVHLQ